MIKLLFRVSVRVGIGLGLECNWFNLAKPGGSITVEFYLYPTVGTVLIHSIKPELTE